MCFFNHGGWGGGGEGGGVLNASILFSFSMTRSLNKIMKEISSGQRTESEMKQNCYLRPLLMI